MKLATIIHEACNDLGATVRDKDAALRHIAELAVRHPALQGQTADTLYRALQEREKIGSTGFGNGFAIPHCRLDGVQAFVVGIVTIPQGVAFDAVDQAPVRVIVFMVAPSQQTNLHIRLLSEISRVFQRTETMEAVLQAQTTAAIKQHLDVDRGKALDEKHNGRNLLCVVVQDEDLFQQILEAIAGIAPDSIAVLDGSTAEEQLMHTPLFAGLWNGREQSVCRLILAWTERSLINETVRRIEEVGGPLDERTGVLLSVHEPFYAAGRLA